MPSKKKYNARFPPARIKKIMQTDEEVGKVAAPVPVIISRVLELFVKNLLGSASELAANNQARTLLSMHLTQAISSDPRLHFLQETVRQHSKTGDGLDLKRGSVSAEDGDAAASSAIAMLQVAAPPPPLRQQQSLPSGVSGPASAPDPAPFPPIITSSALNILTAGAATEGATRSPATVRGRGRPRGRPPKRPLPDLNPIGGNMPPIVPATKRGRGRPRKQPVSPTFVGTDGVTVSSPGLNGPFHPSPAQPFLSHPDLQQHQRSPLIFPGGLTVATSYGAPSTVESAANFSFTVGQAQIGTGSATITCNNSIGSPSSLGGGGGQALGSLVTGDHFQQTLPSSPLSAPVTISRVGGGSRESSPHLGSNGSLPSPGSSGGTILTAPPAQSNPFFSGIKIEIPSLPAASLPFNISSPFNVSISPVSSASTNSKCPPEVTSSEHKQQPQTPPLDRRRSSNSIDSPHRDDATNGKAASAPTFMFGGVGVGGAVSHASAGLNTYSFSGGLSSGPLDYSVSANSLPAPQSQSASTSNLDEDYDS